MIRGVGRGVGCVGPPVYIETISPRLCVCLFVCLSVCSLAKGGRAVQDYFAQVGSGRRFGCQAVVVSLAGVEEFVVPLCAVLVAMPVEESSPHTHSSMQTRMPPAVISNCTCLLRTWQPQI